MYLVLSQKCIRYENIDNFYHETSNLHSFVSGIPPFHANTHTHSCDFLLYVFLFILCVVYRLIICVRDALCIKSQYTSVYVFGWLLRSSVPLQISTVIMNWISLNFQSVRSRKLAPVGTGLLIFFFFHILSAAATLWSISLPVLKLYVICHSVPSSLVCVSHAVGIALLK